MATIKSLEAEINILKETLGRQAQQYEQGFALVSHIPGHEAGLKTFATTSRELRTRVERVEARIRVLGDAVGSEIAASFTAELNSITSRANSLWVDLDNQLSELKGRVDVHDQRLNGHDELFEELRGRVSLVGESSAGAHRRIDELHWKVPEWVYGISVAVGLLAGAIWHGHHWSETIKVASQATKVVNPAANSGWAALLCAVSIGFVAFVILSALFKGRQATSNTASPTPVATRTARQRLQQLSRTHVSRQQSQPSAGATTAQMPQVVPVQPPQQ